MMKLRLENSQDISFALLAVALLALSGCHANTSNGKDDVGINTPFGGISVKTDDKAVQQGVGLAAYPGATLIKKDKGKDEAADVNLSFGNFHLGVKVLSYTTPDAPAKVMAFYRKDMARYGTVIECHGHQPVGTPTRTADGLTCESDHGSHVNVQDDDDNDTDFSQSEELKAGSRRHQHIVGIKAEGTGSKIGLVALDLPEQINLKHHGGSDDDSDKQ